MFKCTSKHK